MRQDGAQFSGKGRSRTFDIGAAGKAVQDLLAVYVYEASSLQPRNVQLQVMSDLRDAAVEWGRGASHFDP
jgi:hypothetical protein